MGKRVSNKRGQHLGARSGRVRIGFHRARKITNVQRQMEKLRKKTILGAAMNAEDRAIVAAFTKSLRKLIPKRMERRGIR